MSNQQDQKNSTPTDNLVKSSAPAQAGVNAAGVEDATVANSGSFANSVLWFLGIASFIGATLVNQYLPAYWQPAGNVWIRIGAIVALVVLGVVFLLLTQQGRGFKKLVADSQVELRRVTWPGKEETIEYTWKVLLVIIISGALIFVLDGISSALIGPFIK